MADLVHVGIAGRVYVRFSNHGPDVGALEVFKRAGARLDRERNLWFVGEVRRDAAITAVVTTFGDLSGEVQTTTYRAAGDGLTLACGWILVATAADWIDYRNPFSRSPDVVQRVSISEATSLLGTAPQPVQAALSELLKAADALAGRGQERKPFTSPGKPPEKFPDRFAGQPATDKQTRAIDVMLLKLGRFDRDRADELRDQLDKCGGFTLISKADASKLIDELGAELAEYE